MTQHLRAAPGTSRSKWDGLGADWTQPGARCATHPQPELWVAGHDHHSGTRCPPECPTRIAKNECATPCPVRETCAIRALRDPDLTGVWGGYDDKDRKAIRRKKQHELTTAVAVAKAQGAAQKAELAAEAAWDAQFEDLPAA